MVSHHIKTSLATYVLAMMIALQIMAPLSVYAQTPPVKTGTNKLENLWDTITSTDWLLKNVGEPAVRLVVRAAIVSITQQVVNWISASGGNNVGFTGNFEQALTNELDDRAGQFLQQLDVIDFCGDIGAYLKLNLRAGAGGLRARAKCSLSAIVSNVQNFYDNFQNGGWEAFLKTNVDIQNNTAGAFLLALDAKLAAETKKKEEFGLRYQKSPIMGIGIKVKTGQNCYPPPEPGLDPVCIDQYEEQTPGAIIEQALKDANKTGIDLGVSAKFIDEAVVAPIVSAMLQRMITSTHGIFGHSPETSVSYNGSGLFADYKEIGSSRDALRSRADAGIFLTYGVTHAIDASVLALRKELTATTSAAREKEIKEKTADLLVKRQTALTEEGRMISSQQSSFSAVMPDEVAAIDKRITKRMDQLDPLVQEVGASPYASPTGDRKTDTLNYLSGSRTSIAGLTHLANQVVLEIDKALPTLSTTTRSQDIATLKNYRDQLASEATLPGGALGQLRDADARLQDEYNAIKRFTTSTEALAGTGNAITAILAANDAQQNAGTIVRTALSFLDSIVGQVLSSFAATSATTITATSTPTMSSAPPIPPPLEGPDSGGDGE